MKITLKNLKLLETIGQHPHWNKRKIAKENNMSLSTVSGYIYKFREYGLVVKGVGKNKFEWALTGRGIKKVKEKVNELKKYIASPSNLYTYRP